MEKNTKILLIVVATVVIICGATFVGVLAYNFNVNTEPEVVVEAPTEAEEKPDATEELYPYETFDMNTFLNFKPDTVYTYVNRNTNSLYRIFFSKLEGEQIVGVLEHNDVFLREEASTTKDELIVRKFTSSDNLKDLLLGIKDNSVTDVIEEGVVSEEVPETLTILKAPFIVGNTWESNGSTFTIEEVSEEYVLVKGVDFNGIENKIYFKEGLGVYKFVKYIDGVEEVYELTVVSEETPKITTKISYLDANTLERFALDVDVSLKTNDTVLDVINNIYINVPEGYASPLPEGTKILSITKDEESDFVHVDFSEEFQTNMNFGASIEAEALACIADTFGELYNVDKVKITVTGKSYESGHIALVDDMITR